MKSFFGAGGIGPETVGALRHNSEYMVANRGESETIRLVTSILDHE
ncbi:MAG: hypothetical protein QOD96_3550, partial [Pseudonocardiales bacterium]|nr:hypothetical protein [Pseudonocardiales bacterium]